MAEVKPKPGAIPGLWVILILMRRNAGNNRHDRQHHIHRTIGICLGRFLIPADVHRGVMVNYKDIVVFAGMAVGAMANNFVIIANGGKMPGIGMQVAYGKFTPMTSETHWNWLGDWIYIPLGTRELDATWLSPGDILLYGGAIYFAVTLFNWLRRKHGYRVSTST